MSLNAATIEILLGKGLTGDDLLAVARAIESEKKQSPAAKRQARYRERRAEGVTSDVTGDVTPPPKEEVSNPPSSEANASGSEAADPVKDLFDLGVALLTATGSDEKQARSLLGKWRKAKGEAEVLQALIDCRARSISNPVEWLTKRFQGGKWVSPKGFEYRGTDQQVLREAEKRNDMATYWAVKRAIKDHATAAN